MIRLHEHAAPASALAGAACSARFFPELANDLKLALHRARHAAEPGGNLLDGVTLHLPQRDRAQLGIAGKRGIALL